MEKARQAISSPNQGVVELLGKAAALLEAAAGLAVCCAVVGQLHPLILALLLLLFFFQLAWGLRAEGKKQALKEEQARANRRLNYIAYGTKGMREGTDIRLYSMAPLLSEITREVLWEKRRVEAAAQRWQFSHLAAGAVMILVRDSAAYLFLIRRYIASELSAGDFSFYFAAIAGVGLWLSSLSEAISGFREAEHYARDFYEFLTLPEESFAEKQDRRPSGKEPEPAVSLELRQVSFSYSAASAEGDKPFPAIRNMSLRAAPGERVAIVGVNGAGKSTLIKLLCGMLTPDQGTVLVNGADLRHVRKKDSYSLFSAVFQSSRLLPVSILENITMGEKVDQERLQSRVRLAGLSEMVAALPQKENTLLVKDVSENGVELSGGQAQRLLLARALYKSAPVLLLDEPTAALDPLSERDIYEKYHRLTKGRTAFFVSHRLASTRFCEKILFLEGGEILEEGTHEELMALNGRYADMFRVQGRYYEQEPVTSGALAALRQDALSRTQPGASLRSGRFEARRSGERLSRDTEQNDREEADFS